MVTAFPHCPPGSPVMVDGRQASYWGMSGHGAVFNYSGHPAVVVPCGQDAAGLPIGVQIAGKRWDESRLLGIGGALWPSQANFGLPPGIERD